MAAETQSDNAFMICGSDKDAHSVFCHGVSAYHCITAVIISQFKPVSRYLSCATIQCCWSDLLGPPQQPPWRKRREDVVSVELSLLTTIFLSSTALTIDYNSY